MKAYLVSIGCDKYQSETLNDLSGAENDASAIYDVLVDSEYSIYEKESSYLLKSPVISDVKDTLEEVLFDKECPDIFTFFFAGHGGVVDGTYYLCLNETKTDRMSFTGLPLTEIFRIVSSSKVKHVNLVIDACNTAGLVNDLFSLIKPELMGAKGSFGISILAAAASDEYAGEVAGQGLLTGSLVNLISGRDKVNSDVEFLDLVNLGRVISTKFIVEGRDQTPSSWGMNLYGPSIFSKNPYHSHNDTISTHDFSFIPPASRVGKVLLNYKDDLWGLYDELDNTEGVREFLEVIRCAGEAVDNTDDVITLLKGVAYRFIEKFSPECDFKQLELLNAISTVLIPHLSNENARLAFSEFMDLFRIYGIRLLDDTLANLQEDKYSLINKDGAGFDALSNYYYLPIRLSKLVGYFSQLLLVDEGVGEKFSAFLDLVRKDYSGHLIVMSEEQAPYLHSFFSIYHALGKGEQVKDLLISYMLDYIGCAGQVSALNLPTEDTLKFLMQRYTQNKVSSEFKSNPDSLGASLLLQANAYGIDEDVDLVLHCLDRHSFHLFIPECIDQFGGKIIENGFNMVLRCGSNFWTCKDFRDIVEEHFEQYSEIDISSLSSIEKFSCLASSFVQPDRIPLMV
ncbi:caspase family protein [Shewanella baltica]|uniref:caspase family protein n=1 Tax=Shewanella baltica TaxID=62322 RepID=UPI003D7AC687